MSGEAMTRQEILDEIIVPFQRAVAADMEAIRTNPTERMEEAWRECIRKGLPPVYVMRFPGLSDTVGVDIYVAPMEGWVP